MDEILEALCCETDTTADMWEAIDGPDSRCGVDYWFRNRLTGEEAYVNDDQGAITVSVSE